MNCAFIAMLLVRLSFEMIVYINYLYLEANKQTEWHCDANDNPGQHNQCFST